MGDGNVSQKFVQFLVIADGELEMTRDDTGLLVVTSGVSSQLENLSSQVLEDGCEVNWSTSTDTLSVVSLAEKTVNTTDWECETGLGRAAVEMVSFSLEIQLVEEKGEETRLVVVLTCQIQMRTKRPNRQTWEEKTGKSTHD